MDFLEINLNMISEAIKLRQDIKTGKTSYDSYMAQMGGMTTIGKMMDRHLKFLLVEKKLKVSLKNVGPNLVGYNPETEKIKCPSSQKIIERRLCLEYSGSLKFEECDGCPVGIETKNLLLGKME